jgi:hypothetical protein
VLAVVIATNWIVNPYGVWRTTVVPRAYRLTDAAAYESGERLSTPFRIRAERPSTLLLGSSKVHKGMLVAQIGPEAFLNAGLSGAMIPELAILARQATANPSLRRVIWGVDFYAFDEKFVELREPATQARLDADDWQALILRIEETLVNLRAFRDSRRVLANAVRRHRPESLTDPVPWPEDLIKERFTRLRGRGLPQTSGATIQRQLRNWINSYVEYRPSPRQLDLLRDTVADVRRTGAEVVLFVPPLSDCELEAIDQAGTWDAFQRWKRALLAAGPYWDFSGYGKLDRTPDLFTDVSHFRPGVGQVILRRLLGLDCAGCGERAQAIWDAGVWVDATTVDAYLARQEATRTAVRDRSARCARLVEQALATHAASTAPSR